MHQFSCFVGCLFYSYTHNIEALSCDEALVDATNLLVELGVTSDDLARAIREDIKEKTGCTASVGMGKRIYSVTLILFQTFMTLFLPWNTKGEIKKKKKCCSLSFSLQLQ